MKGLPTSTSLTDSPGSAVACIHSYWHLLRAPRDGYISDLLWLDALCLEMASIFVDHATRYTVNSYC